MEKKDTLSKALAIIGTLLAWFPILTPIILTTILLITEGLFRFDYLMPAELFLAALVGGGLLLWAARRIRSRQKLIGWSLGAAVILLVGSQGAAVITGLASGETEPAGWPWFLVLASLALYTLALIVLGIGGISLLRDLFKNSTASR